MELTTNGTTKEAEKEPVVQKTTDPARTLRKKLETKTATIGVVGLGYVGLPLAVEYAGSDFQTIGYDLDEERVRRLNAGESYNDDVDDEKVARVVEKEALSATTCFDSARRSTSFLFVCPRR